MDELRCRGDSTSAATDNINIRMLHAVIRHNEGGFQREWFV